MYDANHTIDHGLAFAFTEMSGKYISRINVTIYTKLLK